MKQYKSKFDILSKSFSELNNQIILPKYQRSYVWKKGQQKKLIETLKNGLPFNTLLLGRTKKGFEILDGQQRFTTIKKYYKNPYQFIKIEQDHFDKLYKRSKVFNKYKKDIDNKTMKEIIEVINNEINNDEQKNSYGFVVDKICDIVIALINKKYKKEIDNKTIKEMRRAIENWLENDFNILDVSNVVFPCIVFQDKVNDNDKISTFELANTTGTRLSKFDLCAVYWNDKFLVADSEIIDVLVEKYNNVKNVEIEGFDEKQMKKDKKINLYEYCFALSKLIGKKTDGRFASNDNIDEVDSIAYIIVTAFFGQDLKEMSKLPDKIGNFDDFIELKEAILNSTESIYNLLKKNYTAPDNKVYFSHSDYQIVTYIVTDLKLKYKIVNGKLKKNNNSNKINKFYDYLSIWYLYDSIAEEWESSVDTTMNKLIKNIEKNDYKYFTLMTAGELENKLIDWFENMQKDRKTTISPLAKAFTAYLLNFFNDKKYPNCDCEHIITKDRLKTNNIEKGISSPANLTFIPMPDNRGKGKVTYYEYVQEKNKDSDKKGSEIDIIINEEKIQNDLLYPLQENIEFEEYDRPFTENKYIVFLNKRKEYLIGLLLYKIYNKKKPKKI